MELGVGVNQSNEHVSFFCEPGHCFVPSYLTAFLECCAFLSQQESDRQL